MSAAACEDIAHLFERFALHCRTKAGGEGKGGEMRDAMSRKAVKGGLDWMISSLPDVRPGWLIRAGAMAPWTLEGRGRRAQGRQWPDLWVHAVVFWAALGWSTGASRDLASAATSGHLGQPYRSGASGAAPGHRAAHFKASTSLHPSCPPALGCSHPAWSRGPVSPRPLCGCRTGPNFCSPPVSAVSLTVEFRYVTSPPGRPARLRFNAADQ